jgi:hypothetical protein
MLLSVRFRSAVAGFMRPCGRACEEYNGVCLLVLESAAGIYVRSQASALARPNSSKRINSIKRNEVRCGIKHTSRGNNPHLQINVITLLLAFIFSTVRSTSSLRIPNLVRD